MRFWVVAAALLVFGAACGAYQFPGGPQESPGASPSPSAAPATVSGRVLAVPCFPVEPPQPAVPVCVGRPVAGLELDYAGGEGVPARTFTDSSGQYSIALAPGTYGVTLKTSMQVLSGPLKLNLSAGSTVVANYTLDSGIRVPVPQQ